MVRVEVGRGTEVQNDLIHKQLTNKSGVPCGDSDGQVFHLTYST